MGCEYTESPTTAVGELAGEGSGDPGTEPEGDSMGHSFVGKLIDGKTLSTERLGAFLFKRTCWRYINIPTRRLDSVPMITKRAIITGVIRDAWQEAEG